MVSRAGIHLDSLWQKTLQQENLTQDGLGKVTEESFAHINKIISDSQWIKEKPQQISKALAF